MASMADTTKKIVVIIGSTGTGKTKLSIDIAKLCNGEVVNADVFQMYRCLDIVSAKVTNEERQGIPHHLLDILDATETYSAADYRKAAALSINDILARGKLPIVVGGNMQYIQALLWPDELIQTPLAKRHNTSNKVPIFDLHEELKNVDPVMADRWHPNDTRRISRSLEIFYATGIRHSDLISDYRPETEYDAKILWVHSNMDTLDKRLDTRVDDMVERGMFDEVADLFKTLSSNEFPTTKNIGVLQTIGVKELKPYMEAIYQGRSKAEQRQAMVECIRTTKSATRRYARKQLRWIRNKIMKRRIAVFQVDTSDPTQWESIVKSSFEIVAMDTRKNADQLPVKVLDVKLKWRKYRCEVCSGRILNGQHEWDVHLQTKNHKLRSKRKIIE